VFQQDGSLLEVLTSELKLQRQSLARLGFEQMHVAETVEDAEGGVSVQVCGTYAGQPVCFRVPADAVRHLAEHLDVARTRSSSQSLLRLNREMQARALDAALMAWFDAAVPKGVVERIETIDVDAATIVREVVFYKRSGEPLATARLRFAEDAASVRYDAAVVVVEVYGSDAARLLGSERVALDAGRFGQRTVADALDAVLASLAVRGTLQSVARRMESIFRKSA
jgi:hypothetical protein